MFLTDSVYLTNQMTPYLSQYEKTVLQNNIMRKEDQVQALRYGNAMGSAVSFDMIYRIIRMFHNFLNKITILS